jgi:hypothetical protein
MTVGIPGDEVDEGVVFILFHESSCEVQSKVMKFVSAHMVVSVTRPLILTTHQFNIV